MLKEVPTMTLGYGWVVCVTKCGVVSIFKWIKHPKLDGQLLTIIHQSFSVLLFPPEIAQAEALRTGPTGFYLN